MNQQLSSGGSLLRAPTEISPLVEMAPPIAVDLHVPAPREKASQQSATTSTLLEIWTGLFGIQDVSADDNFFDLGGDSALALQLFQELHRVTGRTLPPVIIYYAPTIAALTFLLDRPHTLSLPPLVKLKSGDEPPFFLTHGLGGTVMDFYQLINLIHTPRAIYGLQARGFDGRQEPHDRIEDMAEHYLDTIKRLQPAGPYYLVGFSLGGLVMLELAQQLLAKREPVGLLVLLDAYPHINYVSRRHRAQVIARQTFLRSMRRLGWLGIQIPQPTEVEVPEALEYYREKSYHALRSYRPRFYSGKVHFIQAAVPTDFPADASGVWSGLTQELTIQKIQSDHLGMMTTHCHQLAKALDCCLQS